MAPISLSLVALWALALGACSDCTKIPPSRTTKAMAPSGACLKLLKVAQSLQAQGETATQFGRAARPALRAMREALKGAPTKKAAAWAQAASPQVATLAQSCARLAQDLTAFQEVVTVRLLCLDPKLPRRTYRFCQASAGPHVEHTKKRLEAIAQLREELADLLEPVAPRRP